MDETLRSGVFVAETAYGAVLLDLKTGTHWNLDPIGSRLIEVLRGTKTITEAAVVLSDDYDAPEHQIAQDLETLKAEMRKAGLLDELPDDHLTNP